MPIRVAMHALLVVFSSCGALAILREAQREKIYVLDEGNVDAGPFTGLGAEPSVEAREHVEVP